MHPEVSILLPFHDAAENLRWCLDSIALQTLDRFEVVAVDDGSRDDSAAVVQEYMAYDGRFRLLQPGRVGLVEALNVGLAACRAPLVARMDADDRMAPRRLEFQHRWMREHPAHALVATQVELFPERSAGGGHLEYVRWQNRLLEPHQISAAIYVESPFAHPSVMYRRHLVIGMGGYRSGDFPEDYDLWLRMHHAGMVMAKLPRTLLYWRDSRTRLSRTDPRYGRERFDRLRAAALAKSGELPTDRPLVIWGAGRRTRRRARHLLEKGYRLRAWVDIDPRKIGNIVEGVPVVSPRWLEAESNHREEGGRRSRPYVLVYVASWGAREEIARALQGMGYREVEDYRLVG
ncbi:MAG TPA: glycosyltransferase [Thiotrichales bacterium]|nr:glycosyltransferase [Thiotrichales bacterium]